MFRKSLTFSLMVHLGIGAFLAGGAARADGGWPEGEIEFTADNASEVFLNGESLGVSNNWKDDPVIKPVKSKLKQGKNVIAVAAWDYEAIAAMSGKFKMPDGTEFDTSKNQIKNWYAWDAAPGVKTACNDAGCIKYGGKKWSEKGFNPLKDLENDGTNIDIPKNWNEINFEHNWDNPGWANGDDIWNKHNYNPGDGWIWFGNKIGGSSDKGNPWVSNNFTLFLYEFTCIGEWCETEDNWKDAQIINVDSRDWNDIKEITDTSKDTYPIFAGGILSFKGSGDQPDYTPNFFLADKDFLEDNGLSVLWNKDDNKDDKNVIDVAGNEVTFTGNISGPGGITFRSGGGNANAGEAILAGENTYRGETVVESGTLALAGLDALNRRSKTTVTGKGRLDLYSYPVLGTFKINDLTIEDGGVALVSAHQPLRSRKISLKANGPNSNNPGGIITWLKNKDQPPITVTGSKKKGDGFIYDSGNLIVYIPEDNQDVVLDENGEDRWQIIRGDVVNAKKLAKNTYIQVAGQKNPGTYSFGGLGKSNAVLGLGALYKGYLEEGSFNLVVVENDELDCLLHPEDCETDNEKPPTITPPPICEGDDCDPVEDKPPTLPGCEEDDDLCDVITDRPGDPDDAPTEDEDIAIEIIDKIQEGDPKLPMVDYGQLAKLVASGLAPRNVDAAGRGLALHNNLLVDAVFDRQPLRQFEEMLVAEESIVGEEAVIEETAPVQPLWLKSDELADGEATAYVEETVAGVKDADVEVVAVDVNDEAVLAAGLETEAFVIEFDGVSYADLQDNELDLAQRDGVSAWVKGFGGNSRADDHGILYNDYDLTAYGTSFGVDVALSETFQIGAYANYGDLDVHQRSGDTGGGSWNPEGWGGGLTAQYSTRNFYVQGLLGANEFSGEQSRNILQITSDLGGNSAKGDKSVTSYLGALRIGAPFKTGGVVLEPQGQVVWTRNHEQGFSETRGTEKNLRLKYKSRTTNFAETELGMKLSVPIRTGDRALLVPSLRAAWLADWNQANEGQEIGYKFSNKTVNFESQLGTENGALIEAGLDYTVQNFNKVSVKLYGRGGMEFWASDRGTTWRASGGVTFQF